MIRSVMDSDAERLAAVYNPFVLGTVISFEEVAVSADEMRARIGKIRPAYPWYVYDDDGNIAGYAYAAPFHARAAYRHTVETSIYVASGYHRRGIGAALYQRLIDDLKQLGVRNAIGIIALPNSASVALHERFGFENVGTLKAVGRKFDRWIDVGFWQLELA